MKAWLKENYFPLILIVELVGGSLLIGFKNGWS